MTLAKRLVKSFENAFFAARVSASHFWNKEATGTLRREKWTTPLVERLTIPLSQRETRTDQTARPGRASTVATGLCRNLCRNHNAVFACCVLACRGTITVVLEQSGKKHLRHTQNNSRHSISSHEIGIPHSQPFPFSLSSFPAPLSFFDIWMMVVTTTATNSSRNHAAMVYPRVTHF